MILKEKYTSKNLSFTILNVKFSIIFEISVESLNFNKSFIIVNNSISLSISSKILIFQEFFIFNNAVEIILLKSPKISCFSAVQKIQ